MIQTSFETVRRFDISVEDLRDILVRAVLPELADYILSRSPSNPFRVRLNPLGPLCIEVIQDHESKEG